jgi:hypothetical protein
MIGVQKWNDCTNLLAARLQDHVHHQPQSDLILNEADLIRGNEAA